MGPVRVYVSRIGPFCFPLLPPMQHSGEFAGFSLDPVRLAK